jgi:hypothetical protein
LGLPEAGFVSSDSRVSYGVENIWIGQKQQLRISLSEWLSCTLEVSPFQQGKFRPSYSFSSGEFVIDITFTPFIRIDVISTHSESFLLQVDQEFHHNVERMCLYNDAL